MIKNWQSHQQYRHFLHEAKVHFDDSQRTRLTCEFASAREKLRLLNPDPVMELLEPFYPPFGRPAVINLEKGKNSQTGIRKYKNYGQ